jgi:hypothetical protein
VRAYYLVPLIPALGLAIMPFLPFVNSSGLWLGLPKMMVWGAVWCLLCTPALLLTERLMARRGEDR